MVGTAGETATHVVCPSKASGCGYVGNLGVQAAVDAARDGDVVLVRAGVYAPEKHRDVKYKQYVIRGYVVIERKRLALRGEPGAIFDGGALQPASALVVNGGDVDISGLTFRGFRAAETEDDLYDGHGVFIIDAKARVRDVTIERYRKMGLTARGASDVSASNLRIQDGHVAIWLEESAQLRLCNSVVRNNDSAGLAAYVRSTAYVYNSVFDGNQDDGLYAENDAYIHAVNVLLLRNKPYGVRVLNDARVFVAHSLLAENAERVSAPNPLQIKLGEGVLDSAPALGAQYRFQAPVPGDPDVRDRHGARAPIGLYDIAGCAPSGAD
jgi:hypothetical protein